MFFSLYNSFKICLLILAIPVSVGFREKSENSTTCPGHMEGAQKESPACSQTISCTGICGSKTTEAK